MSLPLIGREHELTVLESLILGRVPLILIKGEPGIGKSRLLEVALLRAESLGAARAIFRCREAPYSASFPDLLESLQSLLPTAEPGSLDSLELQPAAETVRLSEPGQLLPSLRQGLRSLLQQRHAVIAVENLQCSDYETRALIADLVGRPLPGLVIVCTLQTGEYPEIDQWLQAFSSSQIETLTLAGLSLEELSRLAQEVCGPLAHAECEFLHQKTAGNPFFLVHLLESLRESGRLAALNAQEAFNLDGTPESIAAVLSLRLSALSSSIERQVLEAASCIGSPFDGRLVEAATGLSAESVRDALEHAVKLGFLVALSGPELSEFRFSNELIRDHLHHSLGGHMKRELHARLATYGEHHEGVFSLAELAHHSAIGLASAKPLSVLAVCRQAAEAAEQIRAYELAANMWTLALATVAVGDVARRADLLMRLGLARRASHNWLQASGALQRAHELFSRLGEQALAANTAYYVGEIHRFQLNLANAVVWLRKALNDIDEPLRPNCLALLGAALISLDQIDEGVQLVRRALEISRTGSFISPDVAFWASYGLVVAGDLTSARSLAVAGLDEAWRQDNQGQAAILAGHLVFDSLQNLNLEQAKHYLSRLPDTSGPLDAAGLVRVFLSHAITFGYLGQWREVLKVCEEWRAEVRLAGAFQRATAELMRSVALSCLGVHETAIEVATAAAAGLETMVPLATLYKALFLARAGRVIEARTLFTSVAASVLQNRHSPASLALLADLAASVGSVEMCSDLYTSLLQGNYPILIMYSPVSRQRVLAKLAARLGDDKAAARHFENAVADLRDSDANYELALTYAEFANLRRQRGRRGDETRARALVTHAQNGFNKLGLPSPVPLAMGQQDEGASLYLLSVRQLEVLGLVALGASNREIAQRLFVTPATVARHLEAILAKTGSANRTEAARKVLGDGSSQAPT